MALAAGRAPGRLAACSLAHSASAHDAAGRRPPIRAPFLSGVSLYLVFFGDRLAQPDVFQAIHGSHGDWLGTVAVWISAQHRFHAETPLSAGKRNLLRGIFFL